MARPNAQLHAAIAKFAETPGVSLQEVEQLSDTISGDSKLLKSLNDAAKEGHLNAFAIESSETLIGTYDLSKGVIALPVGAFDRNAKDSSDLTASLRLQDMSLRFAHETYADPSGQRLGVSQEMVGNLQRTINESPALAEQMKAAVSATPNPLLQRFAILDAGFGAGATYDGESGAMNLPAARLLPRSSSNYPGFNAENLTFVLGHETQHGFNHRAKRDAYRVFDSEVAAIARDRNPVNDYTAPIGKLIAAGRVDESKAEIAGWNALASRIQRQDPDATLVDVLKSGAGQAKDFLVEGARGEALVKAGLTFDGIRLEGTPSNIEAMGVHYFDKVPANTPGAEPRDMTSLGPHKEADYANYYGRNAIGRLITIDRENARSVRGVEPQMQINMAQLRLDERLIERLGLEIDPHPERRQAYYDTSQSPPALRHFDHTETGLNRYEHVPIDPEILAGDVVNKDHAKPNPSQPGHPDHALYSQIVTQVKEQDRANGRSWDQVSERLSASLLSLAKESGVTRVDHVVFSQKTDRVAAGENVFIVQGQLNDPAHVRAHMKTEAAVQTPEAVSFSKVEALNERTAQQAPALQAQQQAQEEPSRGFGIGR